MDDPAKRYRRQDAPPAGAKCSPDVHELLRPSPPTAWHESVGGACHGSMVGLLHRTSGPLPLCGHCQEDDTPPPSAYPLHRRPRAAIHDMSSTTLLGSRGPQGGGRTGDTTYTYSVGRGRTSDTTRGVCKVQGVVRAAALFYPRVSKSIAGERARSRRRRASQEQETQVAAPRPVHKLADGAPWRRAWASALPCSEQPAGSPPTSNFRGNPPTRSKAPKSPEARFAR